jgi:hypothetical protein
MFISLFVYLLLLQKKILFIEEDMTQRQYFSGFQKLFSYFLTDPRAVVAEQVAIFLFKYARQLKFYGVSATQQAASIELLEGFLFRAEGLSGERPGLSDVAQAAYTMLSALHTELGMVCCGKVAWRGVV